MTRRALSTRERVTLGCPPLESKEKNRGARLSDARLEQIKAECLRLIRLGVNQNEIAQLLGGASRSRVSRWCQSAVDYAGDQTNFRLLKARGKSASQRLWARIDVKGADDCWQWLGAVRPNGYGTPPDRQAETTAHRAVYTLLVADVPDDMVVDHKCRNPTCCNPRHLQIARQNENLYFVRLRNAS